MSNCSNSQCHWNQGSFPPPPPTPHLPQVKNEVKQYLVVGDTILFCTVQVKWRGCKLMIQWEIVSEQDSYNSFPPLPMLHHSSVAWPFYPSPLPCHYLQMLSAQHMLQPKRFGDLFPPFSPPPPPAPLCRAPSPSTGSTENRRMNWNAKRNRREELLCWHEVWTVIYCNHYLMIVVSTEFKK